MSTQRLLYFFLLFGASIALAIGRPSLSPRIGASVRPLHVFPNGTAAESLCVRDDGSVLIGMIYPSALLYYLPAPSYSNPILVSNFTSWAAVYGITEYAPNVFAVVTGTFSRSGTVTNATGEVWKVDLSSVGFVEPGIENSSFDVTRIARLENVGFLNGAATWKEDTILVADSAKGVVYAVNTQDGGYSVALSDTSMAPNATGPVRLGVNGLRVVNDTLYYTNTNKRSVGKVRLTIDGSAAGSYETITKNILLDDLEVNPMTGALFLPGLAGNIITYVAPNGAATKIAGSLNSTEVPGPTSLRFLHKEDENPTQHSKLLVSTSGGLEYPINGSYIMGGGLYEVDIDYHIP